MAFTQVVPGENGICRTYYGSWLVALRVTSTNLQTSCHELRVEYIIFPHFDSCVTYRTPDRNFLCCASDDLVVIGNIPLYFVQVIGSLQILGNIEYWN